MANKKLQNMSYKSLKSAADRHFSEYVRRSHADELGYVTCITCGKVAYWNDGIDTGHFVSRNSTELRFDLKNCAPQCRVCNSYRGGMKIEHKKYIEEKYGKGTAGELIKKGKNFEFHTRADLIATIIHFQLLKKKLPKLPGRL